MKIEKMLARTGVAAAIVLLGMVGAVQAKTIVFPACSTSSVTVSTDCLTVVGDNNDSVADMNTLAVFGETTWIYAGKALDDGSDDNVDPYNLSGTGNGASSGTWSVDTFVGVEYAALVMKGGSEGWVVYELDLSSLTGTWSTTDLVNGGGNQPNLSHMTLYVVEGVAPVPLPAAGLLLAGGLGAMGLIRRRRRAA